MCFLLPATLWPKYDSTSILSSILLSSWGNSESLSNLPKYSQAGSSESRIIWLQGPCSSLFLTPWVSEFNLCTNSNSSFHFLTKPGKSQDSHCPTCWPNYISSQILINLPCEFNSVMYLPNVAVDKAVEELYLIMQLIALWLFDDLKQKTVTYKVKPTLTGKI